MRKTHDFEHEFVHRGAVGECRVRVYEQEGERPVVVATQGRGPYGQPEPLILVTGSKTIAADLIEKGIIPGSHRAVTLEMVEKWVQGGGYRAIRNSAPFWFVVEQVEPWHRLTFLWFVGYYALTPDEFGDIIREETTRAEVEELIGASLNE